MRELHTSEIVENLVPPERLGPYTLGPRLGQGGYGLVCGGWDADVACPAAIKLHPRDGDALQRFRQEYMLLSWLDHPAFPQALRFGQEEGLAWLSMERVPGEPLQHTLRGVIGTPERIRQAAGLLAGLLEATDHLHQRGIIHGDLKSSNVRVQGPDRVRILDFGGAQVLRGGQTRRTPFVGTPGYAPVEQLLCQPLDARTDLFAIGVIAYRMLTGARPFPTKQPHEQAIQAIADGPPPLQAVLRSLPVGLNELIMSMLSLSPADRPSSAAEALGALRAAIDLPAPLSAAEAIAARQPSTARLNHPAERDAAEDAAWAVGARWVSVVLDGPAPLLDALRAAAGGPPRTGPVSTASLADGARDAILAAQKPLVIDVEGPPDELSEGLLLLIAEHAQRRHLPLWILRTLPPPPVTLHPADLQSAHAALHDGRLSDAVAASALRGRPHAPDADPEAMLLWAEASGWLYRLGHLRAAARRLHSHPDLPVRCAAARLEAQVALSQGRPAAALQHLTAVLPTSGDHPHILRARAWAAAAAGRLGQQTLALAGLRSAARALASHPFLAAEAQMLASQLGDPEPTLALPPILAVQLGARYYRHEALIVTVEDQAAWNLHAALLGLA